MIKLPFLFAGLALWLSSCVPSESDPLACRDGSCAHQSELTFCDIDRAYPDTVQPNECIAPPSADACNRVAACDDPAKPYCNDDSMGTCVECTDNTHCTVDGESCNTNTGECVDGIVIPCTPGAGGDAECAANAEGLDYCSDGGICAACLDNSHCTEFANAGICDATAFECRACDVGGDDCESGLCGTRDEGVCVAAGDVIYVDASAAGGNGCGDSGTPCKTFAEALPLVTPSRNIILVEAGTYDSTEGDVNRIELGSGAATIVANGEVIVAPLLAGGQNAVTVANSADLSIVGVDIKPTSAIDTTDAVLCSSATLSLVGSSVAGADDIGIIGDNCDLTVTASTISGNQGGGISVNGGTYSVTNNFIVENGDSGASGSEQGGVFLSTGVAGTFSFNTLSDNNIKDGAISASSLTCSGPEVLASSNIIVGGVGGAGLIAGNCTLSYSLTDLAASGTNITGDARFVNPALVDYHLQSGSDCIDAADPAATLATDIDGEARPQGAAPDIGADEAE